jgi:hypothetical protein
MSGTGRCNFPKPDAALALCEVQQKKILRIQWKVHVIDRWLVELSFGGFLKQPVTEEVCVLGISHRYLDYIYIQIFLGGLLSGDSQRRGGADKSFFVQIYVYLAAPMLPLIGSLKTKIGKHVSNWISNDSATRSHTCPLPVC